MALPLAEPHRNSQWTAWRKAPKKCTQKIQWWMLPNKESHWSRRLGMFWDCPEVQPAAVHKSGRTRSSQPPPRQLMSAALDAKAPGWTWTLSRCYRSEGRWWWTQTSPTTCHWWGPQFPGKDHQYCSCWDTFQPKQMKFYAEDFFKGIENVSNWRIAFTSFQ